MRLPLAIGTCVLASFLPFSASAETKSRFDGAAVLTLHVEGEVEVDPQGNVLSHSFKTELPDDIREVVSRAVEKFPFEPPIRDGVPARVKSDMKVTLTAQPVAKGFAVRLDDVTFPSMGAPEHGPFWEVVDASPSIKHPGVPVVAVMPLALRISPDGKILDAFARQCIVSAAVKGDDNADTCKKLERNGVRAVKQWKLVYHAAEGSSAVPKEPVTATLQLHFQWMHATFSKELSGAWQPEWRTTKREVPWKGTDAPSIGTMYLTPTGFVQSEPALRLRDGVIGKVL